MVILCDMDNVISDLSTPWTQALNKRYHRNVAVEDINKWHLSNFYPGLTAEQIDEPLHNPDLWSWVKPMEGAQTYLKKLMDEGHEIYIVTAASPDSMGPRFEYVIKRYFPLIDYKHLIMTSNKTMIKGDVLIDDKPANLFNGSYRKILFDWPYNRIEMPEDVIRAHNWKEVYEAINSLN